MLSTLKQSLFFILLFHLFAIAQPQQQNLLVTLISQPKFRFALISPPNVNSWTGWQYFPQLYHRFVLNKDQFVSISKKVMVSYFPNTPKTLGTRVLIDDVPHPSFNGLTGDFFFHDHSQEHSVWLKKGQHTVIVQYSANGIFPVQFGNYDKEIYENHLKVTYLKCI